MSEQVSFGENSLKAPRETALAEVDRAGTHAADLITAWVNTANIEAVQEVAERGTGSARKAARRGLNVLKARHIDVASPSRRTRVHESEPQTLPEAWMMTPDAMGIRVLAITRRTPGGACRACVVQVIDGLGVVRVQNFDTTLTRLKAWLADLVPGAPPPVAVPLEWARAKVAQARLAHGKSKAPEPLGFDSGSDLLEPVPETIPAHPFDSEGFEFSDEDARELAKDSGALHHHIEFQGWLPTETAVQEIIAQVGRQIDPATPPPQDLVGELLRAEMLAATDRYFSPERREELILRMKDAGLSVLARAGEETALKLAAAIQVVGSCGLVTHPPREVSFLCAYFEKAIALLLAQRGGQLDIPVPNTTKLEAPSP